MAAEPGALTLRPPAAGAATVRRARGPRVARVALRYGLLTLLAAVVLFPIYITVVNSLLRPDLIARKPPSLFPRHPQWHTYADAWSDGHLARYLKNSFIVTLFITSGH